MPRKERNGNGRGGPRGVTTHVQSTMRKRKKTNISAPPPQRRRTTARRRAAEDDAASSASDSEVYEVEAILDKKDGDPASYLVKWKGYPDSEATWEVTTNLDCSKLIRAFEERQSLINHPQSQLASEHEEARTRKPKTTMELMTPRPSIAAQSLSAEDDAASSASDSEVYEVEAILDKKDGDPASYLVKWKGYTIDEATWVDVGNLACSELIREYESHRQRDTAEPLEDHFEIEMVMDKKVNEAGAVKYKVKYKDFPEGEDTAWETPEHVPANLIREYEEKNGGIIGQSKKSSYKRNRGSSDEEWKEDDSTGGGYSESASSRMEQRSKARKKPETLKTPSTSEGSITTAAKSKTTKATMPKARAGPTFGLDRMYMGKKVAFSPGTESWMKDKVYKKVGSTFLVGVVCNYKYASKQGKYEVRWLNSYFNGHNELVDLNTIIRGRDNYDRLQGGTETARWTHIFGPTRRRETANVLQIVNDLDELKEYEFSVPRVVPTTLGEVEQMMDVVFDPDQRMRAPTGLFRREDGSTDTRVRERWRHLFDHSASSSLFAYLPLYFWKQVLAETNAQGEHYSRQPMVSKSSDESSPGVTQKRPSFVPFTLDEFMKFLGIMWFMSLVDKGEYSNYWGDQVEDSIFGVSRSSLDSVMTLRRFKELRKAFSFRRSSSVTSQDLERDAAVRIRPILNMLKLTAPKYVDVGRNLAIDEASVSARSKYARHIIVFNSAKPTGKFHFKLYMTCCSTSWIALSFRLHGESTLSDRAEGIFDHESTEALGMEIEYSSAIRQIVLEITRPYYDTGRIVNCDNFYTSVQLAEALRVKGLYCRGTIKRGSRHFPSHVIPPEPSKAVKDANKSSANRSKKSASDKGARRSRDDADGSDEETKDGERGALSGEEIREAESGGDRTTVDMGPTAVRPFVRDASAQGQVRASAEVRRGDYVQAVSLEHHLLAASWCDNTVVSIISNADPSTVSPVTRRVKTKEVTIPAPTCIKEYKKHMQGVDRNDQFRSRFSVADGHSFKKWHKKLAFAIVDIARVNAFLTRKLCCPPSKSDRDAHRQFMVELIQELFNGKWKEAPSETDMIFDDQDMATRSPTTQASPTAQSAQSPSRSTVTCGDIDSHQVFQDKRRKRMCIVCRFENRKDTISTVYCLAHKVSLCKRNHPTTVPYGCQQLEWTCWEKYHLSYLPRQVFSLSGVVNRSRVDYKDKRTWEAAFAEHIEFGEQVNSVNRGLAFTDDTDVPSAPTPPPQPAISTPSAYTSALSTEY